MCINNDEGAIGIHTERAQIVEIKKSMYINNDDCAIGVHIEWTEIVEIKKVCISITMKVLSAYTLEGLKEWK